MKHRYAIEARIDMHTASKTYGRVFGWTVCDTKRGDLVRTYLLSQTGLMLASYPFSDNQVDRCEEIARANGWDGKG